VTFVIKHSGDLTRPLVCTYRCPTHGEFDAGVERDANGDAPDEIKCMEWMPQEQPEIVGHNHPTTYCGQWATWTPTPIACRVRRVEVVRGNWEKPERKTFLDTRKLGEGQDPAEFQAERKKIWNEERHKKVKELLR
jgi:hypothetical protein